MPAHASSSPASASASASASAASTSLAARVSALLLLLLVAAAGLTVSQAGAECVSGNRIMCFTCDSHEDPRCRDPFNWTDQPEKKPCQGCCIKMLHGMGTEEEKIRRSCTDDIDINLFMVDHVCMSESDGKGRMCFCEDSECNGTEGAMAMSSAVLLLLTGMLVLPLGILTR